MKYNIAEEMAKQLSIENQLHNKKITLAMALLNKAAGILDSMQDASSSEIVTRVMERVARAK